MTHKKIERTCCPLCGRRNSENQHVFERDFSMSGNLAPMSRYSVYVCSDCDLAYAGDVAYNMSLDEYYRKMSRYEGGTYSASSMAYYSSMADFFEKYIDKSYSVLDVGCADGAFLNELKRRGYGVLCGVEPAPNNVEAANRNGLTVYEGCWGDEINALKGKKFDVISMTGVLEHLSNINDCLAYCKRYLKEEGLLFIDVPDLEKFSHGTNMYQEFSIEHINYFNLNSLNCLMEKNGFAFQRKNEDCNSLIAIFRWDEEKHTKHSKNSLNQIQEYISDCEKVVERIRGKLACITPTDKVNIWGASSVMSALLQCKLIRVDQINMVVDSNRNFQGTSAYGKVIQNPSCLKKENLPLIIAAQGAQESIAKEVSDMGVSFQVIKLF